MPIHAVTITRIWEHILKSGSAMLPALSFLFQIALKIQLLHFVHVVPYEFYDFFSSSMKNVIDILIELMLNL
jgi:hypothetical protein